MFELNATNIAPKNFDLNKLNSELEKLETELSDLEFSV
jgi:hypothetical protein